MPTVAGKRRNVRFPFAHLKSSPLTTAQKPQKQTQKQNQDQEKRPDTRSTSSQGRKMASQAAPHPGTPALFTQPPPIRDPLVTETTDLQDVTLSKCLPFLKGISDLQKGPFNASGVPALQRDDHVEYLYDSLEDYPAGFVAMDSSRPWMIYWGLAGLTLLGEDISRVHQRCVISFSLFAFFLVPPGHMAQLQEFLLFRHQHY
jgi:protein farnesyltransferase subunit beta